MARIVYQHALAEHERRITVCHHAGALGRERVQRLRVRRDSAFSRGETDIKAAESDTNSPRQQCPGVIHPRIGFVFRSFVRFAISRRETHTLRYIATTPTFDGRAVLPGDAIKAKGKVVEFPLNRNNMRFDFLRVEANSSPQKRCRKQKGMRRLMNNIEHALKGPSATGQGRERIANIP